MKYEYEGYGCGVRFRADVRADHLPCTCGNEMAQRKWGFSVAASFQPHFNSALGINVNSRSQYQSELARLSERASQDGVVYDAEGNSHVVHRPEHNYVPVDLRDKEALGVTNDGLDATYDAWKKEGRDDDARKLKALMDD